MTPFAASIARWSAVSSHMTSARREMALQASGGTGTVWMTRGAIHHLVSADGRRQRWCGSNVGRSAAWSGGQTDGRRAPDDNDQSYITANGSAPAVGAENYKFRCNRGSSNAISRASIYDRWMRWRLIDCTILIDFEELGNLLWRRIRSQRACNAVEVTAGCI